MVKVERSFPAPASLAIESQKVNGRYNCDDVVMQLIHDFHDKCYLCEYIFLCVCVNTCRCLWKRNSKQ